MARPRNVNPPPNVKDEVPNDLSDLAGGSGSSKTRTKTGGENSGRVATPSRAGRSTRPPAPSIQSLEARLTEQLTIMGMFVGLIDQYDGTVIVAGGPRFAAALTKLARENPSIRKALEMMLEGSAWAEVIVAGGMIALPIAAHHGMLPNQLGQKLAPEVPNADNNGAATNPDVHLA